MSVWKTVKNGTMEQNVDMALLEKALENIGAKLDHTVKSVENGYGHDTCDAGIINTKTDELTALGIRITEKNGIELVGDTYKSGIVGDQAQDELMDKIAQQYNKELYIVKLNEMGYTVADTTVNENGEIVMTAVTY